MNILSHFIINIYQKILTDTLKNGFNNIVYKINFNHTAFNYFAIIFKVDIYLIHQDVAILKNILDKLDFEFRTLIIVILGSMLKKIGSKLLSQFL